MENRKFRGQWAGCSNLTERISELQEAHRHFEQMVVSGEIKIDVPTVNKHRRNRIMVEKFKTITIWGKEMKVSIEEYNTHYIKAGF